MPNNGEFHINYSFAKTSFWTLLGLIFSLLFLLIGLGACLAPFLIIEDNNVYDDSAAIETFFSVVLSLILPLIVWPIAYAMFVPPLRHFRNCWLGKSLVIFTQSDVKGYTPFGIPITIKWETINQVLAQPGYGNIVMWDEHKIDSFWSKFIRSFVPIWNPKAVSIQLIYGKEKFKSVDQSFFDFNPYAEERFGI